MSDVVVDANVAVKWVIDETDSDRAQRLFDDTIHSQNDLIGPPMFISEVISIIYQRRRSRDPNRQMNEAEAEAAMRDFLAFSLLVMAPDGLYERAFIFAREHGLTNTYDSLYVVLAQMLGIEMWTDDQALLRALGTSAPWVRSIGDYPLPER
jgi:predicted nucleic acid-binding protein